MTKTTNKHRRTQKNSPKKKTKVQNVEHTHSLQVRHELSETHKTNKKIEFVVLSSGTHQTATAEKDNKDLTDNDSTASSPAMKRKPAKRKLPLPPYIERRMKRASASACKLKNMQPSFSADEKYKQEKKGKGVFDDFELSEIKKGILCKPEEDDDTDFYLNYHPAATIGYEGVHSAFPIPGWMPMTFRPTKSMNLNYLCTTTAAYIFQTDHAELLGREVLIKTNTEVMGDRKALKSLTPRSAVDQEIINLVVARQNWLVDKAGKKKSVWYMPTEFAQFALEAHKSADSLRRLYHHNYMKTTTYVSRMFIPMNDQGRHWYLMVVDFTERKLVWLDSLHSDERDPFRRRAILKMAIILEEIMMHESFGKDITPCCPDKMISSFSVYTPRHIQQQRPASNDCGVWVSKWMIECPFRSDYGHITVNTATRMKLAIYLVKSANNVIYDEVMEKSVKHWEFEQEKRECLVKFDGV